MMPNLFAIWMPNWQHGKAVYYWIHSDSAVKVGIVAIDSISLLGRRNIG